jgi:hypothetical protein
MKFTLLLLFGTLFGTLSIQAQRNVEDSAISTPWVAIHYGINATSGDLADRYGTLNHIGAMAGYKTNRNWVFGLDGNFIFGSQVKMPNLFGGLVDSYGNVTDDAGSVGLVVVSMRGFNINTMVGKVIPILSPNANSGIYVHGGIGYIQHKTRIDTQDQVIPSLELEYRKGYDRYSTGVSFHQFLGYAFMSNQGFVNFYGGFYVNEGITYNRREIFFDQPDSPVSTKPMYDIQYGVKLGWFIPIYQRKPKDFYYD